MPTTQRRGLSRLTSGSALLVAAAIATSALFTLAVGSTLVESFELWTLDLRSRTLHEARSRQADGRSGLLAWIARPMEQTTQVVVVQIDDETIANLKERLPIARIHIARLIDQATAAGATVIAVDLFLVGRSPDPAMDEALKRSIDRSGRVVFAKRCVIDGLAVGSKEGEAYFAEGMVTGDIVLRHDADNVIRRYSVYWSNTSDLDSRRSTTEQSHATLAFFALLRHWNLRTDQWELSPDADQLTIQHPPEGGPPDSVVKLAVTDPRFHNILVDFAGPKLPFRRVSLARFASEVRRDPDLVRGKIVLFGAAADDAHDTHPTPISYGHAIRTPGLYIHGYAIRDMLRSCALVETSTRTDRMIVLGVGLAATALLALSPAWASLPAVGLLALAFLATAWLAYLRFALVIPVATPTLLLLALWIEWITVSLHLERRARAGCEALVASYFSPAAAAGLEPADEQGLADRLLAAKEMLAPDKYEIVSKLGQGGMSVVFKAIQHPIERTVALKFISPRLYRDRDAVARFLREARLAGALLHPNLTAVFDSGESHGVPFIALEFVDGESLKSLIHRKGRLAPAEAAGLMIQALDGLAHVHAAGIVHRDLKSENIMLTQSGVVKITDFGIAKSQGADPYQTMQEVIVGTPAYLSPEQIRGEALTAVSDLYSMGIVLYEMLTGSPPFLGDSTGAILMKHLNDEPPDLESLGLEISRGLHALLRRALAKLPEDRFATAAEMKEAMERLYPRTVAVAVEQAGEARPSTTQTLSAGSIKLYGTTERLEKPGQKPDEKS